MNSTMAAREAVAAYVAATDREWEAIRAENTGGPYGTIAVIRERCRDAGYADMTDHPLPLIPPREPRPTPQPKPKPHAS